MKIYLKSFELPLPESIEGFIDSVKETCYENFYPFRVFDCKDMPEFEFEPLTILYGSNGSGKSTLLNVIADKLNLYRNSEYNRTNFFQRYVNMCSYKMLSTGIPRNSKIITSDDIFDFLLDIRNLNQGIDNRREDLFVEYGDIATSGMSLRSMDDYDDYKKYMETRRLSKSQYVKKWLKPNVQMRSNGESAMDFFMKQIDRNALYLLDEPENSLSPKFQLTLKEFLEDSVVGFNCQFIIATHSPILLSMKNAKIYDLDSISPSPKKWTELENVRTYFELFDKRREEFLDI